MSVTAFRENMAMAFDTLRNRKIRAALTILGIVIGVTSVISVAAIIDGLNGYIQNRIKTFGIAVVLHHPDSSRIHRPGPAAAKDPRAKVSARSKTRNT